MGHCGAGVDAIGGSIGRCFRQRELGQTLKPMWSLVFGGWGMESCVSCRLVPVFLYQGPDFYLRLDLGSGPVEPAHLFAPTEKRITKNNLTSRGTTGSPTSFTGHF